ncbi:MAG: tetratricopeptide repeat protein, partial [Candidatus Dormibacteraeota bacterium]|nr:tetratricopeptide repeat protein [Candidatus Dormibacteraeota bacterium]
MVPEVTFLLTDIEGSSKHWERWPQSMQKALSIHDGLVEDGVTRHGGKVLTNHGEGDSFFAVFPEPALAVDAAAWMQQRLAEQDWPGRAQLRVRMALHTGTVGPDFRGPSANRCARLRACAHGGQVVLSSSTARRVHDEPSASVKLKDLGEHRLRDLAQPERVFQLLVPGLPADFPPLRSLGALSDNLPDQLNRFIGRKRELQIVKRMLARNRLVTLFGPGGSGKTRLALKAAGDVVEQYPGGVWFVDLSGVRQPSLVVQAVAAVVGLREQPGRPPLAPLVERLREKELLLVLDNCEHVVEACAELARILLGACPPLRVLVTSREILNLPGEVAFSVPTLSVPAASASRSPADLQRSEAVALFADRAVEARPGFRVDERNAVDVAQICRTLDGIPLAIELAAARVRFMSVHDIVGRLQDRLQFLVGPARQRTGRHGTLRAAIDLSYDLLDEPERLLFSRLSIFLGGSRLEAVEAVCSGDGIPEDRVLDLVGQLVAKSLVQIEEHQDAVRYHMLETLREYARERLNQAGAAAELGGRHFLHFREVAEKASKEVRGPGEAEWMERLADDYDNFSAALEWARESNPAALLEMAAPLGWFWWLRGRFTEGRRWLSRALAEDDEHSALGASALNLLGLIAWHQRDYEAAEANYQRSREILLAQGDRAGAGRCLNNLAALAYEQGDFSSAFEYEVESRAVFEELEDRQMVAILGVNLGLLRTEQGDPTEGRRLLDENMPALRSLGNKSLVANGLSSVGINALYRGGYEEARNSFVEGLDLAQQVDDRMAVVYCLEGLAWLAAVGSEPDRALRLLGGVTALRQAMEAPASPTSQRREERWLGPMRTAMGQQATEYWQEGSLMAVEDVFELARQTGSLR